MSWKLPYTTGTATRFGGSGDLYEKGRQDGVAFASMHKFEQANPDNKPQGIKDFLNNITKPFYRGLYVNNSLAQLIGANKPKWGLFAYLNPNALYYAMREKRYGLLDDKNPWVTFYNKRTGLYVTAQRIDWGPGKWTKVNFDLSPMSMAMIGGKSVEKNVVARPATPQEIYHAKKYNASLLQGRVYTIPALTYRNIQNSEKQGIFPYVAMAGITFLMLLAFSKDKK